MSLLTLILILVVVGLALYVIKTFIPMDPSVERILHLAVIVFLIIWLLQAFGVIGAIGDLRIGR